MTDSRADAAHPSRGTDTPANGADTTTHRPTPGAEAATNSQANAPEGDSREETQPSDGVQPPRHAPPPQESFDWRGWVLVWIVVVSFLLIPGVILLLPYAESFVESLGIPFRAAYLALPMVPALLLGATAVWAAVRSRSSGE